MQTTTWWTFGWNGMHEVPVIRETADYLVVKASPGERRVSKNDHHPTREECVAARAAEVRGRMEAAKAEVQRLNSELGQLRKRYPEAFAPPPPDEARR